MLLFKNKEKNTYFTVNTAENKVVFAPNAVYNWVRKNYKDFPILTLPDLKTVNRFRKIIEIGAYQGYTAEALRSAIMNDYPELFI